MKKNCLEEVPEDLSESHFSFFKKTFLKFLPKIFIIISIKYPGSNIIIQNNDLSFALLQHVNCTAICIKKNKNFGFYICAMFYSDCC